MPFFGSICVSPGSAEQRQALRQSQRFAASMMFAYFGSALLLKPYVGQPAAPWLAAFSGLMFFATIVTFWWPLYRYADEFQRILFARSLVWGIVATMAVASIWGSVEFFSERPVPHLPLLALPILAVLLSSAAKLLIFRRHRALA